MFSKSAPVSVAISCNGDVYVDVNDDDGDDCDDGDDGDDDDNDDGDRGKTLKKS